ncbi:hypothetical protein Ciccas_001142 [Cichlidogyrus casuarinus]|uniref:Protein phosphatase 1 regulatory subunit 35 C-terminal domain-containing protein n=1 Tax=Cichlidogyrus casuarinus TaxID=1844966 RepID=A0ABD2QKV5_9PLAT
MQRNYLDLCDLSLSSDGSLDLSIAQEEVPQEKLLEPRINSLTALQLEIEQISDKIAKSSLGPTKADYQKAAQHLDPMYGKAGKISSVSEANIPTTISYGLDESLFRDLVNQSVSESDIIREEREKVQKQRKAVQASLKLTKPKETLPEPDLLKYFQPSQHIFQAVDLHIDPSDRVNLLPPKDQPCFESNLLPTLESF